MARETASTADPIEERVRRHLRGGRTADAVTALLESIGPGVLRFLATLVPEDDAKDAFSRFQENVWRGLPGFRWECSLRAWAYRIAWNAVARLARDGYRRRRTELPSLSRLASPPESSLSTLNERRAAVADLCARLGPEERTLLALRVGRALGWDEVAAVLSGRGETISVVALRKRFERLKGKLAGLARERGLVGPLPSAPAAAARPGRPRPAHGPAARLPLPGAA